MQLPAKQLTDVSWSSGSNPDLSVLISQKELVPWNTKRTIVIGEESLGVFFKQFPNFFKQIIQFKRLHQGVIRRLHCFIFVECAIGEDSARCH